MRKVSIICLVLIFNSTLAVEFLPLSEHDVPNPAKSISLDEQGNWLEITVNQWKDRVRTDDGMKSYQYEQGYNYQKKQGFVKVYTLDKELVSQDYSVDYDGMVAREEMLIAYNLVKKNPVIQAVFAKQDEAIELQGGFNYTDSKEGQACSKGERCVHVFANTATKALVLHAVVRLSDRTVPYPMFDKNKLKKRN